MRVDVYSSGRTINAWSRRMVLVGFSAIVLFISPPVLADDGSFTLLRRAYAYAPESNALLYSEEHRETWASGKMLASKVRYYGPNKHLLAEKTIDFRKNRIAPDFLLNDFRDGYQEGATLAGNRIEVVARRNGDQPLKQKKLKVPAPVVVDGGFNEYVLQHWEALLAGQRLQFHFVAPIEQDYFSFTIKRKQLQTVEGRTHMQLEMKPESSLVRLFVAPVLLTYDVADRHLLRFEGMTNLNNEQGKSTIARLVYPRDEVKKETPGMNSALTYQAEP